MRGQLWARGWVSLLVLIFVRATDVALGSAAVSFAVVALAVVHVHTGHVAVDVAVAW